MKKSERFSDKVSNSKTVLLNSQYIIAIATDIYASEVNLKDFLEQAGFIVVQASSYKELTSLLHEGVSAIIVDSGIKGWPGTRALKLLTAKNPDSSIIVSSSDRTARKAVEILSQGAFWYLTEPYNIDDLLFLVQRACIQSELKRDNRNLRSQLVSLSPVMEIAASSPQMLQLATRIDRIANLDSTVLISGESGTGKTTLARLIHQRSVRASKPFVSLSCAAIPRDLLEAELFGHERGAFTGATQSRAGLVETADGGTLFLDEIGDMSLDLQPKLLTLLQDRKTRRVGSSVEKNVNVRIIAATNRNLVEMCNKGAFREDLYFRLNVLHFHVPPLRERLQDIELLVKSNLQKIADRRGVAIYEISDEALQRLRNWSWPGNVRELENVLERASAFCKDNKIEDLDFGEEYKSNKSSINESGLFEGMTLAEIEKNVINDRLKSCNGNKVEVAKQLGISLKSVYNKLAN